MKTSRRTRSRRLAGAAAVAGIGALASLMAGAGLAAAAGPAAAASTTFTSPQRITTPSIGRASPYPSTINVTGLNGTIANVRVMLGQLIHQFPSDLSIRLQGPGGHQVSVSPVGFGQSFTLPFAGTNPNGVWGLYVTDTISRGCSGFFCSSEGQGAIMGWSLTITMANQAPDCSGVTADPAVLWPPNHQLKTVGLSGATDPDDDPVSLRVTGVTQDEAVDGLGDGDAAPDAVLEPAGHEVQLRAERSGTDDGRVYLVAYTATDGKGGECSSVVTVGVPHNRGDAAVDSGDRFNSLSAQ